MKPALFSHRDYKRAIHDWLDRAPESWGLITRLAEAAGCQRSFLSRVLNGPIHLTPDHGYGICALWELSESETEYFMAMLEHARSGSAGHRAHLESKLDRLRREHERLQNLVDRPTVSAGERESLYYSAWHWSAIHILVSIPGHQTVAAIARRLQLPEPLVEATLARLESFGFVCREAGRWRYAPSEIHVPSDSPWVSAHHANWRQRAVLDAQSNSPQSVHFTVVQSMSAKSLDRIRKMLLEFIEQSAREAGPSKEEELVCLTCDLFRP